MLATPTALAQDDDAEVEKWRQERALPFPEFSPEQREKLAGSLDYPPAGSRRRPKHASE